MGFGALILTDQALEAFLALLRRCHSTQGSFLMGVLSQIETAATQQGFDLTNQ